MSTRRGAPGFWIYGQHAVHHAIANPRRKVLRVLSTERRAPAEVKAEVVKPAQLRRLLGDSAAHQGLAAEVIRLEHDEEAVLDSAAALGGRAVALDQVTDPRNVGAVLRSAWAFGAAALLAPERGSPPEGGALAKAACGGLEHVPYLRVGNLARAIDLLRERGILLVGLAEDAETQLEPLAAKMAKQPVAIVAGAEGKGLRRLTRERCDVLARISSRQDTASLNVSNACAIALHALRESE